MSSSPGIIMNAYNLVVKQKQQHFQMIKMATTTNNIAHILVFIIECWIVNTHTYYYKLIFFTFLLCEQQRQ